MQPYKNVLKYVTITLEVPDEFIEKGKENGLDDNNINNIYEDLLYDCLEHYDHWIIDEFEERIENAI